MSHIVVVGAGQAGASLAAKLRNLGHDGAITLLGGEPVLPYQRPPLSKGYLLGDLSRERLYLRPESFYEEQNISLRIGVRASRLDTDAKTVDVGDETLHYDQLALATGSSPRRLPDSIGGSLGNVFTVRDLSDADAMAPLMQKGARVLVVGGGYIGLEAAAVAAKSGLSVTLVEMADRILNRVAAPETSDFFRALHTSHGVDMREGVGLNRLLGTEAVTGAELSDGSQLDVDFVIVGVGILPDHRLAGAAGITLDDGIAVDSLGRTSAREVWAAGDCASFPYKGARIRLESVQNAIDQAEVVAANMLGAQMPYEPHPWFWSDQYDVKLQIAGLNTGYDRVVVRDEDKEHSTSHWYYSGETLIAVDAMNAPRPYMIGKRLIEAGKSPSPELVSSTDDAGLKALLK